MDDFKEINENSGMYDIVQNFGLEGHCDICYDCIHFDEGCRARAIFKGNYADETISKCRCFRLIP